MHLRKAWEALGEISANGAMAGFCNLVETVCPDLVPWIRHKKRVSCYFKFISALLSK